MRSLRSSSLRSRDALHLSSIILYIAHFAIIIIIVVHVVKHQSVIIIIINKKNIIKKNKITSAVLNFTLVLWLCIYLCSI